ncbi:N-acetyltransferase family protein [Ruegeria sp. 2205SS24-7]|uniref:GNAT family N-acetyltransferase n=1 Tax=Ruegeria discodermiae TaxID=3064389 RepID=UPI0027420C63|nr:GNAT family N-acetyltransferase [Ruegeria sp. 2205SS24-7]MDP5217892.1 N-acetyltransferase family protein [Ruegeria sp. 2205SS24-7]
MIIRRAVEQDAPAVAALINDMVRGSLITFTVEERDPEQVAEQIRRSGPRFLVAEEAGEVLGYASYKPFREGPGYRHSAEHSILLAPAAHGRSTGRVLMNRLEDIAVRDEIHVLIAGISSANPAAVGFHKALGFEEVGRMPQVGRKWDQWLDLVLMQKILAADGKTLT